MEERRKSSGCEAKIDRGVFCLYTICAESEMMDGRFCGSFIYDALGSQGAHVSISSVSGGLNSDEFECHFATIDVLISY